MVILTHGKVVHKGKVYVLQSNHRKYLNNLHIHIDKIENKSIALL